MTGDDLAALADRVFADPEAAATLEVASEDAEVLALLVEYARRRQHRNNRDPLAQKRAMTLFRSFLNAEQQSQLRRRGFIYTQVPSGNVYRICPRVALTMRAERHGKRIYGVTSYCYHDAGHELPPADLALAHLLLLLADEDEFLRAANATDRRMQWDGAWRRKLNQARRARSHAA